MRSLRLFFLVTIVLWSCEKAELPVSRNIALSSTQVDMGSNYKYQIWFSLSGNRIVYSNVKTDWDLCFESAPGGWHILLNGAKSMRAYKTTFTNLSEVTDTSGIGLQGKADRPSGNLDSTAFGDWRTPASVYVVDLGYDELGKRLGFVKVQVKTVDANNYSFEWALLSADHSETVHLKKDAARNFVAYSFLKHAVLEGLEPPRTAYDLCFTNYTHSFLDPLQYYQVTGVFTNSYRTRVGRLPQTNFADIQLSDTLRCSFSQARNAIGYDWKTFKLENNQYTVDNRLCYIVQDSYGFYYKLHFTDFYNPSGQKGSPKFEYQRL